MGLILSYRNQLGNVGAFSTAIIITRSNSNEIEDWLSVEIGKKGKDWLKLYNSFGEDKFYFASEEDRIKFILRWL